MKLYPFPLPERLIHEHRGSHGGVQRLHLTFHGNPNPAVRPGGKFFGESVAFVSNEKGTAAPVILPEAAFSFGPPGPALFISPAELLVVSRSAGIQIKSLDVGIVCPGIIFHV